MSTGESFAFQAEINQLLSLIINAFYSNKEVFLRELVSNAIDALDKVRYECYLSKGLAAPDATPADFGVRVKGDRDPDGRGILVIEDDGIGMTREDMIKNLGTIAHSGTRAFMEAVRAGNADVSLIGQFGVGFYSAFLVADRVAVYSKHDASDSVYKWESEAGGTFRVGPVGQEEGTTTGLEGKRGTRVVLYLKDDMKEYSEEHRLREVLKKHSEFSTYPISLWVTKTREVPVEVEIKREETKKDENGEDKKEENGEDKKEKNVEESSGDESNAEEDGKVEEVDSDNDYKNDNDENDRKKTRMEEYHEFEQVNRIKPVWQRKPDEVTPEEHDALYRAISNDWQGPLAYKQFDLDGSVQFKAVLYVPQNSQVDLFQQKKRKNVRLYVKKVFVTDEADELLPDYLNFVHGIVDSDDLPLNVSREMLQQNRVMGSIKKNLVKKSLELIKDISDDPEKYATFYKKFSKNIKLGAHEDSTHRAKLVELLRFHTTKTLESNGNNGNGNKVEDMITLRDYCARMKPGQDKIYFVTADSLAAARSSPCIERLVHLGYEVVLMADPMDEYLMQVLHEYDGKTFACCSRTGLVIPNSTNETNENSNAEENKEGDHKVLLDRVRAVVGDRVHRVTVSNRLVTSPCVIVTDAYGWTANMERIVKAQALRDSDDFMSAHMAGRRILEVNPEHPIFKHVANACDDQHTNNNDNTVTKNLINLAFRTALISSGFALDDYVDYANRVFRIMASGIEGESDHDQDTDSDNDSDDTHYDNDDHNNNNNDGTQNPEETTNDGDAHMEEVD
jgi:molecular chaperone HtpG